MTVALLSIGTELLRGEVADASAPWLANELTQMGYTVTALETVADEREPLAAALKRLADSHGILIATGGLGPSSDDLTAAVVAEVVGIPLHCNEDALATIRRRVDALGIELTRAHKKQASLPESARVLPNAVGTAPGFVQQIDRARAYFLPGVPHEMKRMFSEQVAPLIQASAPNNSFQITLRTYGVRESQLAEALENLEQSHPGVTLAFRSHHLEVDVKIRSRAASYAQARDQAETAAGEVRQRLGRAVYGEGDDELPAVAARLMRNKGWRLAVAESCTGGLIAHQLTSHPASDYFVGGAVTYANNAKTNLLGVSEDALRGHGAVSAEVAAEMAEGARRAFDCDVAIGVTGIAGPSGASASKPLGLVYWSVAHPGGTAVEHRVFEGDRRQVQIKASKATLDLLRRTAK